MSTEDKRTGSTGALHQKLDREKSDEQKTMELLEHPSYVELQQKLTAAEERAEQYWERLLRAQAENENSLRRAERDVANAHKYGNEKFVNELLPIIDSLERAVESHKDEDSGEGTLLSGVSLTLKMLYNALDKFSIKQINPQGEAFNPEWHQAVSTQQDPNVKPGTVIAVLQKGYLLNNRLIRPAMVVVSKE